MSAWAKYTTAISWLSARTFLPLMRVLAELVLQEMELLAVMTRMNVRGTPITTVITSMAPAKTHLDHIAASATLAIRVPMASCALTSTSVKPMCTAAPLLQLAAMSKAPSSVIVT